MASEFAARGVSRHRLLNHENGYNIFPISETSGVCHYVCGDPVAMLENSQYGHIVANSNCQMPGVIVVDNDYN